MLCTNHSVQLEPHQNLTTGWPHPVIWRCLLLWVLAPSLLLVTQLFTKFPLVWPAPVFLKPAVLRGCCRSAHHGLPCQLTSWPRTPQLQTFYCWKCFASQRGKIFSLFPGRKQTNIQPWPSFRGSQAKAPANPPLVARCSLHCLITVPSTRHIIFWGLVYSMECHMNYIFPS